MKRNNSGMTWLLLAGAAVVGYMLWDKSKKAEEAKKTVSAVPPSAPVVHGGVVLPPAGSPVAPDPQSLIQSLRPASFPKTGSGIKWPDWYGPEEPKSTFVWPKQSASSQLPTTRLVAPRLGISSPKLTSTGIAQLSPPKFTVTTTAQPDGSGPPADFSGIQPGEDVCAYAEQQAGPEAGAACRQARALDTGV